MADTLVESSVDGNTETGQLLWGPYWSDPMTGMIIWSESTGSDLNYTRTTDGGSTWVDGVIDNIDLLNSACWYDKETPGDTGTLIHIAYIDGTLGDSVNYVNIDVSDATIGTIRVVDGTITASSAALNRITITKTRSDNIMVAFSTQTEIECYKSSDQFATAGTNIADPYESPTEEDWLFLFPANTADDNDAAGVFWDRSADVLSIKMYDDSANSWTETTIQTGMVDDLSFPQYDGAIRHSDGNLLVAAHSDADTTGDDLLTWDIAVDSIASPTITAKANVFTNQSESIQAAVMVNQQNDDVYIAHLKGGVFGSSLEVVYHKSEDGMDTWGAENEYGQDAPDDNRLVKGGRSIDDSGGRIQWVWYNDDLLNIYVNLVNDVEISPSSEGDAIFFSHNF